MPEQKKFTGCGGYHGGAKMENRELTDEVRAMLYTTHNRRLEINEIFSRPEVEDEIRKAYIAGLKEVREENKKLNESLISATKQNIERQEIIDSLKKEHEEQNEILKQIKNICELALNRKENWSKEELEEFIKQIKKRID